MNAHDPALENAGEQRRRRRRPDSGETDTGIAAVAALSPNGPETPVVSRRELREQRAREEAAAQATQASLSAMPAVEPAEPTVAPAAHDSAAPATPSSGSVNRRSMRERLPEGPAGPAGRGERVPPPRRPVVKTPLAAQGVRGLDETGELSQVRSTRSGTGLSAHDESPVEVTGPLDWSSAVMSPIEEATPNAELPDLAEEAKIPTPAWGLTRGDKKSVPESTVQDPAAVESSADSDLTPVRRSVIKRAGSTTASAAWAPVSGEGAGAAMPAPSLAPPPAASGVFTAVPQDHVGDDAATEDGEGSRPRWMSPLGFVLLAVLGVAVGAGLFFLVLK